jgi:hypothetical protein
MESPTAEISDIKPAWVFDMEELMQEHEEDCLWLEMLPDLKLYAVNSQITSLVDASSPADSQPSVDALV